MSGNLRLSLTDVGYQNVSVFSRVFLGLGIGVGFGLGIGPNMYRIQDIGCRICLLNWDFFGDTAFTDRNFGTYSRRWVLTRVLEFRAKTCAAGIGLGKLVRCMFRLRIRLASVRASAYSKQILYYTLGLRSG